MGGDIYPSDLTSPLDQVARRDAYVLAALLCPGAVVGYRTAMEGGIGDRGVMFITHDSGSRRLPGLELRTVKGCGPLQGDWLMPGGPHISSIPRLLLENLTPSRAHTAISRSSGGEAVEERPERLAALCREPDLLLVRDEARVIAPSLGMESECRMLDRIIRQLLGSRPGSPATATGRGRAARQPIDTA